MPEHVERSGQEKPSVERALAGDEVRDDEVEDVAPMGEHQATKNPINDPQA